MSDNLNYANGCSESPKPAAKNLYVRHISGQGEKWRVIRGVDHEGPRLSYWIVENTPRAALLFPKSEYVLVPPEKRWVDVTKDCTVEDSPMKGPSIFHQGNDVHWTNGYRIRRANLCEFKQLLPAVGGAKVEDRIALIVEHEEDVPDGL